MNRSPLGGVRALLFDIDGTLADTVPIILLGLGDTFEKFLGSRPSDDILRAMIGRPLSMQMNLLGLAEQGSEPLEVRVSYAMDRFRAHELGSRLFEAPVEALRRAHALGVPTILVTSKNRQELLEFRERFPEFPDVPAICAEDAERPKPAADPVIAACSRLGVTSDQAVMIGDAAFDLQAGRAAGVRTVAVTYGAGSRASLEAESPDLWLETPAELERWINEFVENIYATKEN